MFQVVVICIFETGVLVGYHEATFSSHWGENYRKNFGGPMGMMSTNGLPDSHSPIPDGTLGKILSVSSTSASSSEIIISNMQNPEEKVIIDADTIIRDHENNIQASMLTVGSYAVVIGDPDTQGEILARLIRVVPSPIQSTTP